MIYTGGALPVAARVSRGITSFPGIVDIMTT